MRYPVETNFQTRVTDGGVEVTFTPTNSIITYYRLVNSKDIAKHGPVSLASIRHAGPSRDFGDYVFDNVLTMAQDVAAAAVDKMNPAATDV
jgi:hypothetical protein